MDLETKKLIAELFVGIADDAYAARPQTDPARIRIYLTRIIESAEEIKQRLPPAETALERAKRLMPGWPNRLCPTDYTGDFPDDIDENT